MRIRTPARPTSLNDIIEFKIGIQDLLDPRNGNRPVIVPEIRMHVNPTEMEFQYKKIINRYRTRGGWVEEHWGDELDVINVNASTGSFINPSGGLAVSERDKTLSMINFREIFALYKNNANVHSDTGAIISQGSVTFSYDNYRLFGQFSTFSWDESETMPFRFEFTFTFEVKQTVFGI